MNNENFHKLNNKVGEHSIKIGALENNCEVSFAKVEDHVMRILKVIDVQAKSIGMLTDQISELKKTLDNL